MKHQIKNKKLTLWVLSIYLSQCTFAAQIPSSHLQSTRLGIVSIGPLSVDSERAYPLVAKRLQRWLENLESIRASAEAISSDGRGSAFQREAGENRLSKLVTQIWADWENGQTKVTERLKEMQRLRAQCSIGESGPIIQKSYLAEAAFEWTRGNQRKAEELIESALLISPDGRIDTASLPTEVEASPLHAFEAKLLDSQSQLKRICLLHLSTNRRDARVVVNGFPMGKGLQLRLPLGGRYHIHTETDDAESRNVYVSCARPGIKRATVNLTARKMSNAKSLSQLSVAHSVESLFLVEPDGDQFRLFLYTPGVSVDEIPMNNPWTVAEVLDSPGETVPIATDAFLDLLSQHQNSRLSFLQVPSSASPLAQEKLGVNGSTETQWYNSWKFWAIAGGVVGAVAITYFATRSNSVKSNQVGLAVTIH